MSAGSGSSLRVNNDLSQLAPLFRAAVVKAIAECNAQGLDAFVYEAYRSQELQAEYFSRGRTKRPPLQTVTNAPTNLLSWHGYGLAVDVISRSKGWNAGRKWFEDVAKIFKANNCKWGGDWQSVDLPHFQWHRCKPSPSAEARALISTLGPVAVWARVEAIGSGEDEAAALLTETEEFTRTAAVLAEGLKLRPAAGTNNQPITTLKRGTVLEVVEPHGLWFRVRLNKDDGSVVEGFVHGDFISHEVLT
jgi:peptidoglycan LD-endopeptidase CwlK